MITTIYKCDKCGNEQESTEQFWTVGITTMCHGYYGNASKYKDINVCRPCLELLGIHVTQKANDEAPPKPPTIEELIREIIVRAGGVVE